MGLAAGLCVTNASAQLDAPITAKPPTTSACTPVTPKPCPECFAVVVLPDTQHYTMKSLQPQGAAHLDLMTRYICDNSTAWVEPSTGKTMPIAMTLHLGDMVQFADLQHPETGEFEEWARIDAAYDNFDRCDPVVPYLVTTGNHEYHNSKYEGRTVGYNTYFGANRWHDAGYGCEDPSDCSGKAGDWFIGGGDTVRRNSRNNVITGPGLKGPQHDQGGRHRAGAIRAPNGQRFVFLGAELAFDFPPAAPGFEGIEADDSAWLKGVLRDYPNDPTIFFHHSLFYAGRHRPFGPEAFRSDSLTPAPPIGTGLGMRALFDELIAPYPQIFLAFSGHVVHPSGQRNYMIPRENGPPLAGFLRNFQKVSLPGVPDSSYGVGWIVVAVFDPKASSVRVRSYRVDDTSAYAEPAVNYDHTGTPAPTECLDTDFKDVREHTVPFSFDSEDSARSSSTPQ